MQSLNLCMYVSLKSKSLNIILSFYFKLLLFVKKKTYFFQKIADNSILKPVREAQVDKYKILTRNVYVCMYAKTIFFSKLFARVKNKIIRDTKIERKKIFQQIFLSFHHQIPHKLMDFISNKKELNKIY